MQVKERKLSRGDRHAMAKLQRSKAHKHQQSWQRGTPHCSALGHCTCVSIFCLFLHITRADWHIAYTSTNTVSILRT